jgi:hypothetical protein
MFSPRLSGIMGKGFLPTVQRSLSSVMPSASRDYSSVARGANYLTQFLGNRVGYETGTFSPDDASSSGMQAFQLLIPDRTLWQPGKLISIDALRKTANGGAVSLDSLLKLYDWQGGQTSPSGSMLINTADSQANFGHMYVWSGPNRVLTPNMLKTVQALGPDNLTRLIAKSFAIGAQEAPPTVAAKVMANYASYLTGTCWVDALDVFQGADANALNQYQIEQMSKKASIEGAMFLLGVGSPIVVTDNQQGNNNGIIAHASLFATLPGHSLAGGALHIRYMDTISNSFRDMVVGVGDNPVRMLDAANQPTAAGQWYCLSSRSYVALNNWDAIAQTVGNSSALAMDGDWSTQVTNRTTSTEQRMTTLLSRVDWLTPKVGNLKAYMLYREVLKSGTLDRASQVALQSFALQNPVELFHQLSEVLEPPQVLEFAKRIGFNTGMPPWNDG